MKKEIAAGILLAALLAASVWNIRTVDRLSGALEERIELSRALCRQGDLPGAEAALADALAVWTGAEDYTHVFIRHAEIDAVSDAFFDVFSHLREEEPEAAEAAYDRLESHVRCIDGMEHITLKSVF